MKWMLILECSPPVRWKPKVERVGIILLRVIWLYFSVIVVSMNFTDFMRGLLDETPDNKEIKP